ncbi:MAG: sulfurtransferase TusA family protein [Deltaproteobacteria bacterium]|nr:sulfurtransferase TusA family protein [Deltaproteobacteria bacterium]
MFNRFPYPAGRVVENEFQPDRVLDLRGWSCPWCIVKAKSWLKRMGPGEILEVMSTDPEVQETFPHVLERSKDHVIRIEQKKDFFRLLIRRGCE